MAAALNEAALQHAFRKLTDPAATLSERRKALDAIKDSIELLHTPQYPGFLSLVFDPVAAQLTSTEPQFDQSSELQALRHAALEVLSRLPANEALKQYATRLCDVCLTVVKADNQKNAVLGVKVFLDLHKSFRAMFEPQFMAFAEFVGQVMKEFPESFDAAFGGDKPSPPTDASPSVRSFRVLAELPLTMLGLMQVYGQAAKPPMLALLPQLSAVASKSGPDLSTLPKAAPSSAAAAAAGGGAGGAALRADASVSAAAASAAAVAALKPEFVAAVGDLRTAQVRCLNCLAVLFRHWQAELAEYQRPILDATFYLFRNAPDSIPVRRDLIHVPRYIITGPNKGAAFADYIEDVLDEGTLVGAGLASMEALRPQAVMTLCEILHHCRKSLTLDQLGRVVRLMTAYVVDPSLPYASQSTCVRLSLNLVECLYTSFKRTESDLATKRAAQRLLSKILEAFVSKLGSLREEVPPMVEAARAERAARESRLAWMKDPDAGVDAETPLYLSSSPGEKEKEVNDCRLVVQNIVYGMKTLLFSILYCTRMINATSAANAAGAPPPPLASAQQGGMGDADVRACARLLSYGLQCSPVIAYSGDCKDFCEHFAEIFTVMDAKDFVDVFSVGMGELVSRVVSDPDTMVVASHLVQSAVVGRQFAALLAAHLTEHRLDALRKKSSEEAIVVTKLFRLVFVGLSVTDGEPLLPPHLARLLDDCLARITKEEEVFGYLMLLRMLFKAAANARSDAAKKALYQECAPKLVPTLTTLLAILDGPNCSEAYKPLLVELCLTLPAPLSALLPLLPKLMRPLVTALKGGEDLSALGLRTLECWVDSLNPEYLEPAMADVVTDVMQSLWALLRPQPGSKSQALAAMTLLGKLGGRNRRWLQQPAPLEYKKDPEHGLRLVVTFHPDTQHAGFLVPIDRCVALAKAGIYAAPGALASGNGAAAAPAADKAHEAHYKEQALTFMQVCLAATLNLRIPEGPQAPDGQAAVDQLATVLMDGTREAPQVKASLLRIEAGVKTRQQLTSERAILQTMIAAAVGACGDERLAEKAKPFSRGLCRHFAMLYAAGVAPPPAPPATSRPPMDPTAPKPADPSAPEPMPRGLVEFDVHVILDALLEVLCDPSPARATAAVESLSVLVTTTLRLHEARKAYQASKGLEETAPDAGPAPPPPAPDAAGYTEGPSAGATATGGGANRDPPRVAAALGLPRVLDDLLPRVIHCCWEDSWGARLGGVAAVRLLWRKLPAEYLAAWLPQLLRALLVVTRHLPEHSAPELAQINETLAGLIDKCYGPSAPGAAAVARYNELHPAPPPPPLADEPSAGGEGSAAAGKAEKKEGEKKEEKEGEDAMETDGAGDKGDTKSDRAGDASAGGGNKSDGGAPRTGGGSEGGAPASTSGGGAADKSRGTAGAAAAEAKPAPPPEPTEPQLQRAATVLVEAVMSATTPERTRASAQAALEQLGGLVGRSVSAWLRPVVAAMKTERWRLIPIKTVPYAIGQASAFAYCCRQEPRLFRLGQPEVSWLAKECFVLADKEDATLFQKLNSSRVVTPQLVTRLKVAALEVLVSLSEWREFSEAADKVVETLRKDIIKVFFKNLMSPHEAVSAAARAGLASLVRAGLGKDVMHDALRPILPTLGNFKSLSLQMLQGLGRLLELLRDWFNPVLGEKLLDHLKHWLDPESLIKGGPFAWRSGEEVQVAAAILDLFWRLPNTAVKFLETRGSHTGLVALTVQLEQCLPKLMGQMPQPHLLTSPYREPLCRFLARYPEASVKYFLEPFRLASAAYISLLTGLLTLPGDVASPLVDRLTSEAVEPQLVTLLDPEAAAAAAALPPAAAAAEQVKEEGGGEEKAGGAEEEKEEEEGAVKKEETAGGGEGEGKEKEGDGKDKEGAAMDVDGAEGAKADGAGGEAAAKPPGASPLLAGGAGDGAAAAPREVLAGFHAVELVAALSHARPGWLPGRAALFEVLRKRWDDPARTQRLAKPDDLPPSQWLETRWLAKALLSYIDANRGQYGALLALFDVYETPNSLDMTFLPRYVTTTVAKAWPADRRRGLLGAWVDRFSSGAVSERLAAEQLELLVLPVLQGALDAGDKGLVDKKLVDRLLKEVLKVTDSDGRGSGDGRADSPAPALGSLAYGEPLRVRLCHLATLLLRLSPELVMSDERHKKRLITWFWRLLKAFPEESPCRSYAFAGVAQMLTDPGFSFKLCSQAWVAALRHTQPEPRRGLMREAFDLLVPRLVEAEAAESGDREEAAAKGSADGEAAGKKQAAPQWARFAKRTLLEEGHATQHLLLMWQMIVRHPDAFYPARSLFVSQIINSLSKLALATNSQLENRKLAIDLAALLVRWEERRIKEHKEKYGNEPDPEPPASSEAATAAAAGEGSTAEAAGGPREGSPDRKRAREEGASGGGAEGDAAAAPAEGGGGGDATMTDAEPPAKQARGPDGEAVPSAAPAGAAAAAAPAAATAAAAPAAAGAAAKPAPRDGEYALSPQQADALLHLLIRVAFVCADAPDREMQALRSYTLKVFRRAAGLFRDSPIKLPWMEKLLQNQRDKDPIPAVPTGWEVLAVALEVQPRAAPATTHTHFVQLLGPCFGLKQQETVGLMAATLRRLFQEHPMDDPARCSPEAANVLRAVDQALVSALTAAADLAQPLLAHGPAPAGAGAGSAQPVAASPQLLGLCCALAVVQALKDVAPPKWVAGLMVHVVKALNRCSREVAQPPAGPNHQAHYQLVAQAAAQRKQQAAAAAAAAKQQAAASADGKGGGGKGGGSKGAEGGEGHGAGGAAAAATTAEGSKKEKEKDKAAEAADEEPEYGTVTWAIYSALGLAGTRLPGFNPDAPKEVSEDAALAGAKDESKRMLLQSLILLLTGSGAKWTDASLFTQILALLERWLFLPACQAAPSPPLSFKEALLLLQRFAHVEQERALLSSQQQGAASPVRAACQRRFLDLLLRLCTDPSVPQELRDDVFTKVERLFMLGLRAPDPALRQKFSDLYARAVPATMFDRLHFVVVQQDWQAMAHQFWIKQALDFLLGVVKDDEAIVLAPNSAQIAPLLPGMAALHPGVAAAAAAARTAAAQQAAQQAAAEAAASAPPADGAAAAAGDAAAQQQQPGAEGAPEAVKMEVDGAAAGADAAAPADGGAAVKVEPSSAAAEEAKPSDPAAATAPAAAGGGDPAMSDAAAPAAAAGAAADGTAAAAATAAPAAAAAAPAAPAAAAPPAPRVPVEPFDVTVTAGDLPEPVSELLTQHVSFLQSLGRHRVADLLGALREYGQVDPYVPLHLWVLVFPIVWSHLKKEQQIGLAKPIIHLLAREYHQRQAFMRPNVMQAMLEAISLSQPQPKVPPELLRFLGKTFCVWQHAVPLLESHTVIFPDETRCFDSLAEMYKLLHENDAFYGAWRKRCEEPRTRLALSLAQHGQWVAAQSLLGDLNQAVSGGAALPSRGEGALWVDQWVGAAKQLNQWDALHEYAVAADNNALLADSLWRLSEWERLRDVLTNKQSTIEPSPQSCLIRAYAALQALDMTGAENHVNAGFQHVLHKWWQLPEQPWHSNAHCALLQQMQQLVELRESVRVMYDISTVRPEHSYSDVKDILETWRLRLPNDWDPLLHWQDVLVWRNTVYNVVISAFNKIQVPSHMHQMGYRDKAWSVNRLGAIAAKHGCPDLCIHVVNNMYGYNAMEVQEAFVKIREQAKAYLAIRDELSAGLNMLNTTNLDYFGPHHQAEIFRLKGVFLQELNDPEAANAALATSLMLWRTCPEAWVSWGAACDAAYERAPASAQAARYLQYTAHCYLQGVRLGSEEARDLLPRLLLLLSFDDADGAVGAELQRAVAAGDIPTWVWFAWIPQLLTSLSRPEAARVKPILKELAQHHPQSVYYWTRVLIISSREGAHRASAEFTKAKEARQKVLEEALKAAGEEGEANAAVAEARAALASLQPPPEVAAFQAAKEVFDEVARHHPILRGVLETLIGEIGSKFMTHPRERLLAVVTALLTRCYKMHMSGVAPVSETLTRELSGVCKACFSGDPGGKARGVQIEPHVREAFVRDLNPEAPTFPPTLGELTKRLKAWRNKLQMDLEDRLPNTLRLEDECRALLELQVYEVEMPGQYLAGREVTPESCVYLEHIRPDVAVVRRNSGCFRRIAFVGSDGRTRHFLLQTGQNTGQGHADERLLQLMRLCNTLLERQPDARKRSLAWHTPAIVPVWPQLRLLEEEVSYASYNEAYEVNCARFGREPDLPLLRFKERLAGPDGMYQPDPTGALRLAAYQEVCERIVSENVFSQYIYKTLPTHSHLWMFKKTFCKHMALSGLLCHMLFLGGRQPSKIMFARDSGKVFQTDMIPLYNERGLLDFQEYVPFRLTRNIKTLLTEFALEGTFVTSMASGSGALLARGGNLQHVLGVFFRDELIAWLGRRTRGGGGSVSSETVKPLVTMNVSHVFERVRRMAPESPEEALQAGRMPHSGAAQLVELAQGPQYLCKMDPLWSPWY